MKVQCICIIDCLGTPQTRSEWLTIGKVYDVLSIEQGDDRKWSFRIMGDGVNGVALFRLEEFEIISETIPPSWIAAWYESGLVYLTPKPWSKPGFWAAYYDHEPESRRIFEEERKKIIESEEDHPASRHQISQ